MNKIITFFAVFAILSLVTVLEAKVVKFSKRPVRFGIELKSIYDDNIFLYSPEYISDFQHQIRSYRFPINTYDDLINNLNLSLRVPFYFNSHFNIYYKQYLYTVNSEKSYQIISGSINKPLTKPLLLRLSYLYLPNYLIRYYRNPLGSSTQYIGCNFSEQLITFGFDYTISKLKINPFIRYEIDNYKKNFDYYDSKAIRLSLNATWTVSKQTNIEISFESKMNNALGPAPDISYYDNGISFKLTSHLPKYDKLGINLSGEYSIRDFTTTNSSSIDPYHKDRSDNLLNLGGGVFFNVSKNLQVNLNYEYESRKVKSPSLSFIEEVKNYTNNRIVLGLKFNPSRIFNED